MKIHFSLQSLVAIFVLLTAATAQTPKETYSFVSLCSDYNTTSKILGIDLTSTPKGVLLSHAFGDYSYEETDVLAQASAGTLQGPVECIWQLNAVENTILRFEVFDLPETPSDYDPTQISDDERCYNNYVKVSAKQSLTSRKRKLGVFCGSDPIRDLVAPQQATFLVIEVKISEPAQGFKIVFSPGSSKGAVGSEAAKNSLAGTESAVFATMPPLVPSGSASGRLPQDGGQQGLNSGVHTPPSATGSGFLQSISPGGVQQPTGAAPGGRVPPGPGFPQSISPGSVQQPLNSGFPQSVAPGGVPQQPMSVGPSSSITGGIVPPGSGFPQSISPGSVRQPPGAVSGGSIPPGPVLSHNISPGGVQQSPGAVSSGRVPPGSAFTQSISPGGVRQQPMSVGPTSSITGGRVPPGSGFPQRIPPGGVRQSPGSVSGGRVPPGSGFPQRIPPGGIRQPPGPLSGGRVPPGSSFPQRVPPGGVQQQPSLGGVQPAQFSTSGLPASQFQPRRNGLDIPGALPAQHPPPSEPVVCSSTGTLLTSPYGNLTAPISFPQDGTGQCQWTIAPSELFSSIEFQFSMFQFDENQNPNINILEFIYENGPQSYMVAFSTENWPSLDRPIVIETDKPVRVIFQADSPDREHHFLIGYKTDFKGPLASNSGSCGIPLSSGVASFESPAASSKRINATRGTWPWLAELIHIPTRFHCSAAIINERWLLTAASCFEAGKSKRQWQVVIGRHDWGDKQTAWDGKSTLVIPKVKGIYRHNMFRRKQKTTKEDDLSLVFLDEPLSLGKLAGQICLPVKAPTVNDYCIVASWDRSGRQTEFHPPIMTTIQCQGNQYLGSRIKTVSENMVCAGSNDPMTNECQGDVGSPLMCFIGGKWELHGVLAIPNCGSNGGVPGIYTKVFNYMTSWIQPVLKKFS